MDAADGGIGGTIQTVADVGGSPAEEGWWCASRPTLASSRCPEPASTSTARGGFTGGFVRFLQSGEFADVVVVVTESCDGHVNDGAGHDETEDREWHLHSVILAAQSEFFHKALTAGFLEKKERRIRIECAGTTAAWPQLVDFFYTDAITISNDNVLPLLALARQLMVGAVEASCTEFLSSRLTTATAMSYLRQAVQYNLHELQRDCVVLVAKGLFHLYNHDVTGLPWQTVEEVLQSEELTVNCEAQVLEFVMRYLRHTNVEPDGVAALAKQIRLPYLDNDTLATLASHGNLPRDHVLEAALLRMAIVDKPVGAAFGLFTLHVQDLDLLSLPTPPRQSYCCNLRYGLPGGTTYVDVDLESVWERLIQVMAVKVSSIGDGHPLNVLSPSLSPAGSGPWFETMCSDAPPSWVEVQMPPNVVITSLTRYTYAHGHRRSGYYRMRNFKTQVAEKPGGPWMDLHTRNFIEQNEVLVAQFGAPASASASASTAAGAGSSAGTVAPSTVLPAPQPLPGVPALGPAGGGIELAGGYAIRPQVGTSAAGGASDGTELSASGLLRASSASAGPSTTTSTSSGAVAPRQPQDKGRGFQALRIVGTTAQEDGVHRLCLRELKMFGTARIDIMAQQPGVDLVLAGATFAHSSPLTRAGGSSGNGCDSAGGGGSGELLTREGSDPLSAPVMPRPAGAAMPSAAAALASLAGIRREPSPGGQQSGPIRPM